MANNPFTKQNILDAVAHIEKEKIALTPATKYQVLINDKLYPPKEILRYANELAGGNLVWDKTGGEATKKYLADLNFKILFIGGKIESSVYLTNLNKALLKSNKADIDIYYDLVGEIIKRLNLKENDPRITVNIDQSKKLSFIIGQRICLQLAPKNEKKWCFISNKKIEDTENIIVKEYDGPHKAYYIVVNYPEDMISRLQEIVIACEGELNRSKVAHSLSSNNPIFSKSLFNSDIRNQVLQSTFDLNYLPNEGPESPMNTTSAKNTILYGPPGTGKTYHSITHAISIIENKPFEDIETESSTTEGRKDLKTRYDNFVENGQIVFTSFHQSLSYEDFIEGIKPQKMEEADAFIRYEVEPGIFKNICSAAKTITSTPGNIDWDNPKFYKMSVGGKDRPDLHEWCIDNNVIGMAWGGTTDLQPFINERNWNDYKNKFTESFPELVKESTYNIQASFAFLNMKENDIVIVSKGNHIIDAIGIIEGPYYFDDQNPIDFVHFRKVKWITKNLNTNPERFLKKGISQMSLYEFSKEDIKIDAFKELTSTNSKDKPYILIIDEINRGNVSQIFGELITLIEDDKRLGQDESLEVTLPYSKEKFGVPQNLYIIGTMNTADRSVEALDTALRRRFSFVPMMPKAELLSTNVDGINLSQMLRTMNDRLQILKDNDHTIGHAWLMNINTLEELQLTFENKILPLMQEYFYNDYEKLGLVLGDAFFQPTRQVNDSVFARFTSNSGLSDQYRTKTIYSLKPTKELTQADFISIYENNHVS